MTTRVIHSLMIAVILTSPLIAEDPVDFADPTLKAAVEEELSILDPTPTDMLNLFPDLYMNYKGIANLTGLEYAVNLQKLKLRGNEIEDITPLSGLTNLYDLDLSRNDIKSISALSSLTNLKHLDVHWNQITNISVVSGLTALETLIVRFNHNLTNISPVSGLTSLERLDIGVTDVSNISSISNLLQLTKLYMDRTEVTDLSSLSSLTQLRNLSLIGNNIHDISPLLGLTSLDQLNLNRNHLSQDAYASQLQTLVDNNPGINLSYDPNPRAPGNVTASDGTSKNEVYVIWQEVPNGPVYTTYYRVSRSASDETDRMPVSDWQSFLNFADTTAQPGIVYTYWVQTARSPEGVDKAAYSESDTGWLSVQPSLSISSSVGGSVVLPGEGAFSYSEGDIVDIVAEPTDRLLFSFSHWTGSAVDAGQVAGPNSASTSVVLDDDYTLRAQFVSLLETVYVDTNLPDDVIATGSVAYPLRRIQDAIEVASAGSTIKVGPGIYPETLELIDKAIQVLGYDPNQPTLTSFPVLDGNGLGPVVRFSGGAECVFSGFVITGGLNETGSAIVCDQSSPRVSHCLVVGNRTTDPNGGVVWCHASGASFVHCTITDNAGGMVLMDSDVRVVNTILWGNTHGDLSILGSSVPEIRYSDIGGGWDVSSGTIDADPLFVLPGYWADEHGVPILDNDPDAIWTMGDYHLQSAGGRWSSVTQQWVLDALTSVCIDGGDPNDGVGSESVPNGDRVNMGVYGGTSQASRSKE